jgi:cell division protein FtsL
MNRGLVLLLGVLLFASSMGLITAQHRARGLFVELERAQGASKSLEAERDRLRIELGRNAQPASVETAARRIGLQPIEPPRVVYVPQPPTRGNPAGDPAEAPTAELAARGRQR